MIRRSIIIIGLALLLAFGVGCDRSRNVTPEASSAKNPQRIVSLAPNCTEILFALGLGDKVVAVTSQCNYPPEAAKKKKIGDVSLNKELIIAANPDLVVGHGYVSRQALAGIKALKIRTVEIDPKTLSDVGKSIQTIADACGVSEKGAALAEKVSAEIAAIKPLAGKKKPSVLFVVQASPLWAAGPDTFVGEMIKQSGGINVFNQPKAGFAQLSQEAALAAKPDFIFVADDAALEFFKTSGPWKTTPAIKNGHLIRVDPDLFFRPGPRMTLGLKLMFERLNGK